MGHRLDLAFLFGSVFFSFFGLSIFRNSIHIESLHRVWVFFVLFHGVSLILLPKENVSNKSTKVDIMGKEMSFILR